jgi:hypothetical protein
MILIWSMEWIEGERPGAQYVSMHLGQAEEAAFVYTEKSPATIWGKTSKQPHTSMNAEDLVVDDNTQCKEIEHIRKVVPNIRVPIFPRAFRVKSV